MTVCGCVIVCGCVTVCGCVVLWVVECVYGVYDVCVLFFDQFLLKCRVRLCLSLCLYVYLCEFACVCVCVCVSVSVCVSVYVVYPCYWSAFCSLRSMQKICHYIYFDMIIAGSGKSSAFLTTASAKEE